MYPDAYSNHEHPHGERRSSDEDAYMGMPGGTPGMSGMQSAHMQQCPMMRPQGGAPGMAPPPGGGAYPQLVPCTRELSQLTTGGDGTIA